MSTRKLIILALLLAAGAAVAVPGGETLLDTLWQRPTTARDTVIVPDRFLRRWDPITVFFEDDEAKAAGPADEPEKHARIEPDWPGAWTWLDRRTLQFKPAEPWPPLRRFTVTADGETARVSTLMTPPMRTAPRDGADGLEPVETITLTFPAPVPIDALARMVTVELRALPGLGDGPVQRLGAADFTVKALQRPSADADAEYTLTLRRPIPAGMKVTLRFALSLDDGTEAVSTVDFSTARPFRVEQIGCRGESLPVGPDGATYSREQPLRCGGDRTIAVDFTAELAEWGPIEGRTLVRFEPAVEDVEFEAVGRRLQIRGDFERETAYRLTVAPAPVKDRRGRPLELRGEASAWLYFPRQSPYLKWAAAAGIAEAAGPMRVPLTGRGHGRADLRIHRVDPLDRNFWPFADRAVGVDESRRPPGPGEMPAPWTEPDPIPFGELQARLAALGSPGVSTLVDLPLRPEGDAASFGLDLAPHLARIAGPDSPGHYLVGLRPLDGSTQRSWMRLQVTDLALTTVEAAEETWFVVTSLASGAPVDKATVKVEAVETRGPDKVWRTLFEGRTDRKGMVQWKAPGSEAGVSRAIRRISVEKARDVLVLDPDETPERFHDDHWRSDYRDWLQWAVEALTGRSEAPRRMCHLFSERPMYRPEHDVHLKGWLRTRYRGALEPVEGVAGRVEIRGPGGAAWRLPVTTSATGGFYARWVEEAPPTGVYEAVFHDETDAELCRAAFEVEAYRLPTFAVDLVADEVVPLDRPFATALVASWYAGGQVVERPVSWRVTQFPYTWTPKPLPGFVYSSDGRYSRTDRFESRPAIVAEDLTDNRGGATLELDPSTEPTAAPRTYVVEATVTGDDDQTVTATKRIHAVPAFALGVKLPRYLPTADVIAPEIIVAGPDGALVEGVEVTITLKRRAWHAHLQASDFSRGEARYVTDVVDEVVTTTSVQSGKAPITAKLPIDRAGVWLVELEARDRLGRAQVVTVDLYAGGAGSVSWDKPKAGVFALAADRAEHAPGQTANVVLQSPYQSAEALVIIETPTGNRYRWLPVRGGKASFGVEIDPTWAPKLPIHVVLMRGRVE
ncbi:MAG: alpha-2-macroglobulin, partial [Myxococcales bacterium]|nr:alpha-2-macroglobulin [Myxococcales bacterium]